jgi:hypothetical protein
MSNDAAPAIAESRRREPLQAGGWAGSSACLPRAPSCWTMCRPRRILGHHPPAPLSAGGAVRHDPAAAQFLGGAPPPASAAAPHVAAAGRAVAAGVPRTDPGLRAGAAGPARLRALESPPPPQLRVTPRWGQWGPCAGWIARDAPEL